MSTEEVSEVFEDHDSSRLVRAGNGRYLLAGRTQAGRRIAVILVDEGHRIAGPISAPDATQQERRRFFG